MKKNKLYSVNPWNKRMFAGGGITPMDSISFPKIDIPSMAPIAPNQFGIPDLSGLGNIAVPASKTSLLGKAKAFAGTPGGAAALTAASSLIGGLANKGISGGLESGAGNTISSLGSTVGGAVGQVNPLLGAGISAASGLVGGLANRAFGMKTNQAALNAANEGTSYLNNFTSNAGSFDDVQGPTSMSAVQDAYKGGWFSRGKARRKNEELKRQRAAALDWANRSVDNNIDNLIGDQMNDALANYAAYGGALENIPADTAVGYGFMSDYLTMKNRQNEIKDKGYMGNMGYTGMFALGGDLQSHGADWSDGMKRIENGGSHESNVNGGVQMSVDSQNVPNLVEEGEVIFNDFVYSNRIKCDATTKERFHLPRKKEMSYADVAKKLEKEGAERPNDPLSQAAFKKQMGELAEMQERQKREMEEERMRKAFEKLSPEEKKMVMQRVAEEEAATMMQQSRQEMACGGRMNKYPLGGVLPEVVVAAAAPNDALISSYNPMGLINAFENMRKERRIEEALDMLEEEKRKEEMDKLRRSQIHYYADGGKLKKYKYYQEGKGDYGNPAWFKVDKNGRAYGYTQNYIDAVNSLGADYIRAWALEHPDDPSLRSFLAQGNKLEDLTDELWRKGATDGKYGFMHHVMEKMAEENWVPSKDNPFAPTKPQDTGEPDVPMPEEKKGSPRKPNSEDIPDWVNPENKEEKPREEEKPVETPTSPRQTPAEGLPDWMEPSKPQAPWQTPPEETPQSPGKPEEEPPTSPRVPGSEDLPDWVKPAEPTKPAEEEGGTRIGGDEEVPAPTQPATPAPQEPVSPVSPAPASPVTPKLPDNPNMRPGYEDTGEGTVVPDMQFVPKHKYEGLRYAGLFGPAVGLGMMAAGVGKPDYSGLNAAVSMANQPAHLANWKPIGDYMTYKPFDRLFYANQLQANARATDRALSNSVSPSKAAGLLANGYNTTNALGNLYRQAEEYNLAQRAKVADFNRGTNQYNSQAYQRNSEFNADALNRSRQYASNIALNAAAQKMGAEAGWYNSLYGNMSNLFKGLGDLGRENKEYNMMVDLLASGAIPGVTEERLVKAKMGKMKNNGYKVVAKGGKLNKKKGRRGLTF